MIDSNVQAYILIAILFTVLAILTYAFHQRGQDVKTVANLVPLEFAQYVFRMGMEQASTTAEEWDDDALKQVAGELGYVVIENPDGGFTLKKIGTITPPAVKAQDKYDPSNDH